MGIRRPMPKALCETRIIGVVLYLLYSFVLTSFKFQRTSFSSYPMAIISLGP